MEYGKVDVNDAYIQKQTFYAKKEIRKSIENHERLKFDVDRDARLDANLCPQCHYLHKHRIGGRAMTTQPCGICGEDVMYTSTATDKLCPKCAEKNGLCKQCGALVDYDWGDA